MYVPEHHLCQPYCGWVKRGTRWNKRSGSAYSENKESLSQSNLPKITLGVWGKLGTADWLIGKPLLSLAVLLLKTSFPLHLTGKGLLIQLAVASTIASLSQASMKYAKRNYQNTAFRIPKAWCCSWMKFSSPLRDNNSTSPQEGTGRAHPGLFSAAQIAVGGALGRGHAARSCFVEYKSDSSDFFLLLNSKINLIYYSKKHYIPKKQNHLSWPQPSGHHYLPTKQQWFTPLFLSQKTCLLLCAPQYHL